MSQRTSNRSVPEGLARQIGRMAEDASRNYPGGTAKAELAKGNPNFAAKYHGLLDELAAEQTLRSSVIEQPAWKTIEIGFHKDADAYRSALEDNGFRIRECANDIMGKPAFTVSDQPTSVDLVLITVAELGFPKESATRSDIYKRVFELDLEACPPEVGPQLRLQYMDQPDGESLFVGMEPIANSYGDLTIFCVGRDGSSCWLRGCSSISGNFVFDNSQWIFARRK